MYQKYSVLKEESCGELVNLRLMLMLIDGIEYGVQSRL